MEEIIENGCLGIGEKETDFLLCEADADGLPELYEKDDVRFEYNQGQQDRSKKSCTIFSAVGAVSDLKNYEFSIEEIKEIDELSYSKGRVKNAGRYVASAVDLVCKWWNEHHADLGRVAYYRISKYDDKTIKKVIDKKYNICSGFYGNSEFRLDYAKDGVLDGTTFGTSTYGHAINIANKNGKNHVKDNYKGRKYNRYEIANPISKINCFHQYGYIFTNVSEDNIEKLKRYETIKAKLTNIIALNSDLRKDIEDNDFKAVLHYSNNKNRTKLEEVEELIKGLK